MHTNRYTYVNQCFTNSYLAQLVNKQLSDLPLDSFLTYAPVI